MRLRNLFKDLTKFELGLWITSVLVIIASFCWKKNMDKMICLDEDVKVSIVNSLEEL